MVNDSIKGHISWTWLVHLMQFSPLFITKHRITADFLLQWKQWKFRYENCLLRSVSQLLTWHMSFIVSKLHIMRQNDLNIVIFWRISNNGWLVSFLNSECKIQISKPPILYCLFHVLVMTWHRQILFAIAIRVPKGIIVKQKSHFVAALWWKLSFVYVLSLGLAWRQMATDI